MPSGFMFGGLDAVYGVACPLDTCKAPAGVPCNTKYPQKYGHVDRIVAWYAQELVGGPTNLSPITIDWLEQRALVRESYAPFYVVGCTLCGAAAGHTCISPTQDAVGSPRIHPGRVVDAVGVLFPPEDERPRDKLMEDVAYLSLDVDCPTCGALSEDACSFVDGKFTWENLHKDRIYAALAMSLKEGKLPAWYVYAMSGCVGAIPVGWEAIGYSCGKCSAKAGHRCTTSRGGNSNEFHDRRLIEAYRHIMQRRRESIVGVAAPSCAEVPARNEGVPEGAVEYHPVAGQLAEEKMAEVCLSAVCAPSTEMPLDRLIRVDGCVFGYASGEDADSIVRLYTEKGRQVKVLNIESSLPDFEKMVVRVQLV